MGHRRAIMLALGMHSHVYLVVLAFKIPSENIQKNITDAIVIANLWLFFEYYAYGGGFWCFWIDFGENGENPFRGSFGFHFFYFGVHFGDRVRFLSECFFLVSDFISEITECTQDVVTRVFLRNVLNLFVIMLYSFFSKHAGACYNICGNVP